MNDLERGIIIPRPNLETITPRTITPRENLTLVKTLDEVVLDVLCEATPLIADMIDRGVGREAEGDTTGREDEDKELGIDLTAEEIEVDILEQSSKKHRLSFFVLSEHHNYTVGHGKPDLFLVLDPIENSDEYRRGLPTPQFIVFSVYNLDHQPIAGGASNLHTQHLFINSDGQNFSYNPRTQKAVPLPLPPEIKSIKDPRFVIASYDGKYKYISMFNQYLDSLNRDRNQNGSFHGKGGSHSYLDLARGSITEYVMFNEPRGETDAGLAFAIAAGCEIVSVNMEDGSFENYRFDPNLQYARVPFQIASRTPEVRDETIKYYLEAKKKIEERVTQRKDFEEWLKTRNNS